MKKKQQENKNRFLKHNEELILKFKLKIVAWNPRILESRNVSISGKKYGHVAELRVASRRKNIDYIV